MKLTAENTAGARETLKQRSFSAIPADTFIVAASGRSHKKAVWFLSDSVQRAAAWPHFT